uniref:mesoderm induction early response protein 1-like n=1 Tax=Styela clava TaxID=7725 RepID=UPI001939CE9A|nr:mesoderm induction early response protein 1-like [Styela clava]
MNESKVLEGDAKTALPPDDDDFEPTADMMVHDFDDETTLNEDDDDDDDIETNEDELADLAKEGEMPLEQLLALYYSGGDGGDGSPINEKEKNIGQNSQDEVAGDDDDDDEAPKRSLRSTSALLDRNGSGSDSDPDFDETAVFHEEEHKKPRIGEEYQVAEIPIVISRADDKYTHIDEQVWVPWILPEDAVEQYLKEIAVNCGCSSSANKDDVSFIQDNEDALFLLSQTNNDPEEALKRFKSRPNALKNEVNVWSEEECKQFEDGLTVYGKDFFMIHLNKVRTKSVRDIVKFYYIWKKSERYDQFTAKTRLGKKKENMQASVTDYMDRLLDETDHVGSSSLLSQAGGNLLKYYTTAHSIALMEHLKQLEAEKASKNNTDTAYISSSNDVDIQNKTLLNSAVSTSSTNNTQQIYVNNSNNNNHNSQPEIVEIHNNSDPVETSSPSSKD